jgi:threonine/homoserine/homoserine lactone efflux protein
VAAPGLTRRERALSWALTALVVSLFVAVGLALLLRSRVAAWAVVAIITAEFAIWLGISIVAYRSTMRREWPKVEPLPDDDDDW